MLLYKHTDTPPSEKHARSVWVGFPDDSLLKHRGEIGGQEEGVLPHSL